MGVILTRIRNVGMSQVFNFDAQLEFRRSQLKQQATAQSVKQAEFLAQLPLGMGGGGGGGGSGGGGAGANQFGQQANNTMQLNGFLDHLAPALIFMSVCAVIACFIAKLDRGIMFVSSFLGMFFISFKLGMMFTFAQTNNMTNMNTLASSFVIAATFAAILSFGIYNPSS